MTLITSLSRTAGKIIPPSSQFGFQTTFRNVGSTLVTGAKGLFSGSAGGFAKGATKVGAGVGIAGVLTGLGLSGVSTGLDDLTDSTGIPQELIFIGLGIVAIFIIIMVLKR